MIIAAIIVLAGVVLAVLANVLVSSSSFDFSQAVALANTFFGWLSSGASFVKSFFIYPELFDILLGSYIAVIAIYEGYKFVMWVVTKIPMLGVSSD